MANSLKTGFGWWFVWRKNGCSSSCQPNCHPRDHYETYFKFKPKSDDEVWEYVHELWLLRENSDHGFERDKTAEKIIELDKLHGLDNIVYWHAQGCGQYHQQTEGRYYPYKIICNDERCIDWMLKSEI